MAGGFQQAKSMALSDDEQLDWMHEHTGIDTPDAPEYPPGLCFTLREATFEDLGIGAVQPGETVRFMAFARAINVNREMNSCRIEAEIDFLALGDSKMVELDDAMRPTIALDENDHERLDLDETCERGDMLHLIGTAQVKSTADTEWGGKCLSLQITEMSAIEDEDLEGEDDDETEETA